MSSEYEAQYTVVVNDEGQYSIWRTGRQIPAGWRDAGVSGSRETCLSHISEVWTDMRPLSLRRAMDRLNSLPAGAEASEG